MSQVSFHCSSFRYIWQIISNLPSVKATPLISLWLWYRDMAQWHNCAEKLIIAMLKSDSVFKRVNTGTKNVISIVTRRFQNILLQLGRWLMQGFKFKLNYLQWLKGESNPPTLPWRGNVLTVWLLSHFTRIYVRTYLDSYLVYCYLYTCKPFCVPLYSIYLIRPTGFRTVHYYGMSFPCIVNILWLYSPIFSLETRNRKSCNLNIKNDNR